MFSNSNLKALSILSPLGLTAFLLGFAFPSNAQISGVYPNLKLPFPAGQAFPVTGTHSGAHRRAIDFGSDAKASIRGQSVLAMKSGKVTAASTDRNGGNYIFVDHGDDFCSLYVHLDKMLVKSGDTVQQGQKIGTVGNTGLGGQYHLHAAVIKKILGQGCSTYGGTREIAMGFIENNNVPLKLWNKVVSQNVPVNTTPPIVSNAFTNPTSALSLTQASVNLFVKADNLANRTIYWQMYRGQVGNLAPRTWSDKVVATSNSITLGNLDGPGDTLKGVYYFTVVSLSPIAPGEAAKQRTKCSDATGRVQLCDFRNR
jgi:Peptidase family M23